MQQGATNAQLFEITLIAGQNVGHVPLAVKKFKSLQPIESVVAEKIADTVNIVDTEDSVKYMPSIFVRKRNYGNT